MLLVDWLISKEKEHEPSNFIVAEDRNQMFQPIFPRGSLPESFKASFSRTKQTANKRRRQKDTREDFSKSYLPSKCNQDKKLLEIFRRF